MCAYYSILVSDVRSRRAEDDDVEGEEDGSVRFVDSGIIIEPFNMRKERYACMSGCVFACICMYVCAYECVCMCSVCLSVCLSVGLYICVCMRIYVCTYLHVHVCMYACMYVCLNAFFVRAYV